MMQQIPIEDIWKFQYTLLTKNNRSTEETNQTT